MYVIYSPQQLMDYVVLMYSLNHMRISMQRHVVSRNHITGVYIIMVQPLINLMSILIRTRVMRTYLRIVPATVIIIPITRMKCNGVYALHLFGHPCLMIN
jgi:hypothetical protein